MKMAISYDNLTVCGYPSVYMLKDLEFNPFVEKMYQTPTGIYHYNFVCTKGAFLQIRHETDWHMRKGAKPVRFEFNPNKYRTGSEQRAIIEILKRLFDCHITRRDIAIDIYGENLNNYVLLDKKSGKQSEYRTGTYKAETLYMGAKDSDEMIRIYDKNKEQKIESPLEWWRVEAVLRGDFSKLDYYDPFERVVISEWQGFHDYEIKTRAMLLYLQANPNGMKELAPNSRSKYKKMLLKEYKSFKIDLSSFFKKNAEILKRDLEDWLQFTMTNSLQRHYKIPIVSIRKKEGDLIDIEKDYIESLKDKMREDDRKAKQKVVDALNLVLKKKMIEGWSLF